MFKLLSAVLGFWAASVLAQEIVPIYSPYPPGYTLDPALIKVIDRANNDQNRFKFIIERRPGADTLLALKALDANKDAIAMIGAPFARLDRDRLINKSNYSAVLSFGEACWAVVSTLGDQRTGLRSLQGQDKLTWGAAGKGSASHITSLQISHAIKTPIMPVMYKSAAEAGIALVGDHGINLVLMPVKNFQQYSVTKPSIKMLAMHCPIRHHMAPDVPTLLEQGIPAPTVNNTLVTHVDMSEQRRREIKAVLSTAMIAVGQRTITELTDFVPPYFYQQSSEDFHSRKIAEMQSYLEKYQAHLQ